MAYEVRFKPSAAKAFAKLDKAVQERIAPKLDALATTPRPPGAEKLVGEDAWRIVSAPRSRFLMGLTRGATL
jgi:mRNA interferase RelE/StbE